MTEEQERHLLDIKKSFESLVDTKYRKGQREHGGNLFHATPEQLINWAIDEAIDQVVYLLTLRDNLFPKTQTNEVNDKTSKSPGT